MRDVQRGGAHDHHRHRSQRSGDAHRSEQYGAERCARKEGENRCESPAQPGVLTPSPASIRRDAGDGQSEDRRFEVGIRQSECGRVAKPHCHRCGHDDDEQDGRRRLMVERRPDRGHRCDQYQAGLEDRGDGQPSSMCKAHLHARGQIAAKPGTDHECGDGHEGAHRVDIGCASERKSDEDDIARHVRGEHVAESQKAHRIHKAGRKGEQQQRDGQWTGNNVLLSGFDAHDTTSNLGAVPRRTVRATGVRMRSGWMITVMCR